MDQNLLYDNDALHQLTIETKNILKNHATNEYVRDDYAEITDLCLKFLGVRTSLSFKVVGALNNTMG